MTVDDSWAIIHDWLQRHHPSMRSLLRGPAHPAALAELEEQIGQTLPDDFKRSYLIHDGSERISGILVGLPLMSLAEIHSNWEMWTEVASELEADDDLSQACRSHPPGAVKLLYANRAWIPFAGDSQNFVAIDFDPGPAGKPGQIINTGRDDEMRHVIADTFSGFLEFVARQFVAGRVELSNTAAPEERWLQLTGDGGDLLTGLRPLLGLPESWIP
jgi:cell wall assembly regulator SMI1